MAITAPPLPLEKTVARMALRASIGNAGDQKDPLPFDDSNMLAGMSVYRNTARFATGLDSRARRYRKECSPRRLGYSKRTIW